MRLVGLKGLHPLQRFSMLPGLREMLFRTDDPAILTQGVTRIRDLTVKYKPYINSESMIGLLQQIQQRQSTRPQAAHVAAQGTQAVAAIRAAP